MKVAALVVALALAATLSATASGGETLLATYQSLQPKLAASPFGRPLYLESQEQDGRVSGAVFAVVDHPFRQLRTGLDTPTNWCDVLILHLNVNQCVAGPGTLQMVVGRKRAKAGDGSSIAFHFTVLDSASDHFHVALQADEGPMGTQEYRLVLETIPLTSGTAFLRLSYSYVYGSAARLAMGTYLRTVGKDKVGFTPVGQMPDGSPLYVGGLRGTLERNTMRYYLAIDTYLDSASQPPADRAEWRLTTWYAATERYSRQLHELTEAEYLALKTP